MDSLRQLWESVLVWLMLPPTFYGAAGAFLAANHKRKPIRQIAVEVFAGAVCANMLCPLITQYAPENAYNTLVFLAGWGGLELVGRLYESTARGLEKRMEHKIGGEG